mgnify:CR=1 FL=1
MYTANDENFDVTLSVITQEEHFIADGKIAFVLNKRYIPIVFAFFLGLGDELYITFSVKRLGFKSGKTENVMEISTLVLTPHNVDLLSNTYEYTLTGSQSSVSGSISKNRLGINLACKINDISTLGDLQNPRFG